mgnify:CR=1 FL=1
MTEKKIKLNATNEVQEFVNAASECNFDINLHYQRAIVDAKSFLGVFKSWTFENFYGILWRKRW